MPTGAEPPDLSAVRRAAHLPPAEAVGVLCDDQLARWHRGERVTAEAYLAAAPAVAEDPDAAFELIYHEFALRTALGDAPDAADYFVRFPAFVDRLRLQLALRQAIQPDGVAGTGAGPAPGTSLPVVPGYTVYGELGRGGMGVVYEALDVHLNRRVALKTISAAPGTPATAFQRLEAEAEALARLQHPNVVQVYEVVRSEAGSFIALELVAGGSLGDQLRAGPLAPPEAARLVGTLAWALHEVHRHGLVHRDLKPSNVLFTAPDAAGGVRVPKITDFGLAKFLDAAPGGMTRTGDVLGTPAYMAPEQVAAAAGGVGPGADVYALGAVLYECLAGRPPFRGPTAVETLWQVRYDAPVSLTRLCPAVPRDLSTICLKCLEKAPARRYRTAADLAADLDRFVAGRPVAARPIGSLGRLVRFARRAPLVTALTAVLLASLVGGLFAVNWQWRQAARNLDLAEASLYQSRLANAASLRRENEIARAEALLDLCLPPPGGVDRRGWEWYYLKRLCRPARELAVEADWVFALALSPAGDELAAGVGTLNAGGTVSTGGEGALVLRSPLDGRRVEAPAPGPGAVESVGYSADGRLIACGSRDGTARVRSRGGDLRFEHLFRRGHTHVAVRPDGAQVAVGVTDQYVVFDVATGSPLASLPFGGQAAPAYTPDGQWLACPTARRIVLWSPSDGRQRSLDGAPDVIDGVAVSPNGSRVVAVGNGEVKGVVWDTADGRILCRLTGLDGPLYAAAFQPRGTMLATAGADRAVRLWDPATGEPLQSLHAHTHAARALAFSPDGTRVYSAGQDRRVLAWDVTRDPRGCRLPGPRAGWLDAVEIDPDGPTVRAAYLNADATLRNWNAAGAVVADHAPAMRNVLRYPGRQSAFCGGGRRLVSIHRDAPTDLGVWDVQSGQLVTRLTGHMALVGTVAASPDGTRVASAAWQGEEKTTKVWDVETDREVYSVPGRPSGSLALDPANRLLAVGSLATPAEADAGVVELWDLASGRVRYTLPGHPSHRVTGLAFSPDGRTLASVGLDDRLRVHDTSTGRVVFDLLTPPSPTCVEYSPDGRRIAVVGYDGVVVLWDAQSGMEVFSLPGLISRRPEDRASSARVRFSPDGRWLVSTNWDGSVNLWDGRPLTESE